MSLAPSTVTHLADTFSRERLYAWLTAPAVATGPPGRQPPAGTAAPLTN